MSVNKSPQSPSFFTYCVPAYDVQPIPEEDYFDHLPLDGIYPSASAEYFTYPVDLDDPDFCDIITDLAQGELCDCDLSWGPSAVALPVQAHAHDLASSVSIAVPESYVTPFSEKGIVIPADAVNALDDDDFKTDATYLNSQDFVDDFTFKKNGFMNHSLDHKTYHTETASRLKEKRDSKKHKSSVAKSVENHGLPKTSSRRKKVSTDSGGVVTARQVAASNRERVKGKFKQNKTQWVAVTEFLRQTHIQEGEADDCNNVYFPHAL